MSGEASGSWAEHAGTPPLSSPPRSIIAESPSQQQQQQQQQQQSQQTNKRPRRERRTVEGLPYLTSRPEMAQVMKTEMETRIEKRVSPPPIIVGGGGGSNVLSDDDAFKPTASRLNAQRAARSAATRKARAEARKWEAPFVYTDDKSPLAEASIRDILLLPQAWDILSKKEQSAVLALFPDDTPHILDAGTDQARPNRQSLKNDNNFRYDCSRYCENIALGKHNEQWLHDAWVAHEKRKRGDFDDFAAHKFERDWGVKLGPRARKRPRRGDDDDHDGGDDGGKDGGKVNGKVDDGKVAAGSASENVARVNGVKENGTGSGSPAPAPAAAPANATPADATADTVAATFIASDATATTTTTTTTIVETTAETTAKTTAETTTTATTESKTKTNPSSAENAEVADPYAFDENPHHGRPSSSAECTANGKSVKTESEPEESDRKSPDRESIQDEITVKIYDQDDDDDDDDNDDDNDGDDNDDDDYDEDSS